MSVRQTAKGPSPSLTKGLFALGLAVVLGATGVACGSEKSQGGPQRPTGVAFDVQRFETVGAGASTGQDAAGEERAILDPLVKYYDGTLLGVVFPDSEFQKAFEGFTTTIGARARTEHASLMTPADVADRLEGPLQQELATATISVFSPSPGNFTHAGVRTGVAASGTLDDGTPVRIYRDDFFVLERSARGWIVIAYESRQRIDAPPQNSETSGGSGS